MYFLVRYRNTTFGNFKKIRNYKVSAINKFIRLIYLLKSKEDYFKRFLLREAQNIIVIKKYLIELKSFFKKKKKFFAKKKKSKIKNFFKNRRVKLKKLMSKKKKLSPMLGLSRKKHRLKSSLIFGDRGYDYAIRQYDLFFKDIDKSPPSSLREKSRHKKSVIKSNVLVLKKILANSLLFEKKRKIKYLIGIYSRFKRIKVLKRFKKKKKKKSL
jgi:hypothetical protein